MVYNNVRGIIMSAQPEQYLSLEEYFKLEETSDIKHEYHQGVAFAMTGATENHNLIAVAVSRNLDIQLDRQTLPALSE